MNRVSQLALAAPVVQPDKEAHKLAKAAQEFEAILLSTWLEKIQDTFAGSEEGGDAARGTLSSMGTQAIASALAARGGIGIAGMLLKHLGRGGAPSPGTTSPARQLETRLLATRVKVLGSH